MDLLRDSLDSALIIPRELLERPVAAIMTAPAVSVTEETPLGELAAVFGNRRINRLPVVTNDGAVLGIITRSDMIAAISDLR